MPKILTQIQPSAIEILRAKVIEILGVELAYQVTEYENTSLDVTTFLERFTPINQNEYPAIVLRFVSGNLQSQDQISAVYKYTFWVECYCSNPYDSEIDGDAKSAMQVQKILSACRSIIKNPEYSHLDLPKPLIGNISMSTIEMSDLRDNQDTLSVMYGRFTLEIDACEGVELMDGVLLDMVDTVVKLHNTNKGFRWTKQN